MKLSISQVSNSASIRVVVKSYLWKSAGRRREQTPQVDIGRRKQRTLNTVPNLLLPIIYVETIHVAGTICLEKSLVNYSLAGTFSSYVPKPLLRNP